MHSEIFGNILGHFSVKHLAIKTMNLVRWSKSKSCSNISINNRLVYGGNGPKSDYSMASRFEIKNVP